MSFSGPSSCRWSVHFEFVYIERFLTSFDLNRTPGGQMENLAAALREEIEGLA